MKLFSRIFVVGAVALAGMASMPSAPKADVDIIGSGASFPFPLYSVWVRQFSDDNDGIRIDYQAKGSGAGIQDLINNTVEFAASDAAMSDEEIAQVPGGVAMLPMTAGEIVLAYNLDGVDELKLPNDVYPAIFRGAITQWNDPAIADANEGVELPDEPITVVRRSDSSGTTYVFTQHLAAIDPMFKDEVGVGKTVQWPKSDKFVAAPKNDGITATIKQTPGSIGYIEYGYAKLTNTNSALLENAAENFVAAGPKAGSAALASADFSGGEMRQWVTNPTDPEAYPIATFTWMLFYKDNPNQTAEIASALHKFIEYGLTEGQEVADQYGYIPLPDEVIAAVRAEAKTIQPYTQESN